MSTEKDRTLIVTNVLRQHVTIDRRKRDGVAWLKVGDPAHGRYQACVALSPDEAWAVAQALLAPHQIEGVHDE